MKYLKAGSRTMAGQNVPVGSKVRVRYRDGTQDMWFAIELGWRHIPDYHPEHDIIAYKPEPTP